LRLLKKLHQNHLRLIINNLGIIEQELMLLEPLLKRFQLLNKLRRMLMFLRTLNLLPQLLLLLLKVLMKILEIEKVLRLTHGTSTGLLRLFLNQPQIHTALTELLELVHHLMKKKKPPKLMDQVRKRRNPKLMLRRTIPIMQLKLKKPVFHQLNQQKMLLLQKLQLLFNLETQA
jgi:hypothetical protein